MSHEAGRIVITGASSGIGRATARRLARRGARLILGARRDDALRALAGECKTLGGSAVTVPADVTVAADLDRLAERAHAAYGGFDAWVNNAGVLMIGSLEDCPADAIARVIEVNLIGTALGTRVAVAHFKQTGSGIVVNTASLLGRVPVGFAAAYVASKYGVEGLAAAVRQELMEFPGIRICNVLPAAVDTPILRHAANYSGKSIRPFYPLVGPDRGARAIEACLRRPRNRKTVGIMGGIEAAFDRVAPWAHRRLVAIATTRALRRARPHAPTDGNLFSTMDDEPAAENDLRKDGRHALGAGAVVAVGAIAVARRAQRHGGRHG